MKLHPQTTGLPVSFTFQRLIADGTGTHSISSLPDPTYKGAAPYRVLVFALGSSTVTVNSVAFTTGVAWTQVTRKTSSNRAIEVWVAPYDASIRDINITYSGAVDAQIVHSVINGVDAFGTPATFTGTGVASAQVATGAVDSMILDFFLMPTANAVLTVGGDQTQLFSTTLDATNDVTLSGSYKDSVEGAGNYLWHQATVSGEWIHVLIPVSAKGRRDTTYQAIMAKEVLDRFFLVEVGAAEKATSGWTDTGSNNIYSRPFTPVMTGGLDRSGIQRTFDHMEVNGISSLRKNTLAEMATATSLNHTYFFDSSTNTIYMRMVNNASPATYQSVTVEFCWLLANRVVDFTGGNYYDPRLTGVLPSVQGEMGDQLFGVLSYPSGNIQVSNADGFFDTYSKTMYWKNRKVTFFYGGAGLTRAQYKQVGTMQIDEVQVGFDFLQIQLRQLSVPLQNTLPQVTVQQKYIGEFPLALLTNGVLSQYVPYVIGNVSRVRGTLLSDSFSSFALKYDYTFGDWSGNPFGHFRYGVATGQIRAVYAVDLATGVEISLEFGSEWFEFTSHIKVHEDYSPDNYAIIADVGDVQYAGNALYQLLVAGGVSTNEIDSEAFARFDVESPIPVGIWQDSPVAITELVKFIERSAFVAVVYTREGYYSLKPWLPTNEDFDDLPQLSLSDLRELPRPMQRPSTPFFEVIVQWGYQPYWNTWQESSILDVSVIGLYKTQETFYLRTCLSDASISNVIAQRYHILQQAQPVSFELEETGIKLIDAQVIDRFRLSLPRAPGASGIWEDEVVQVINYDKQFNPESITVVIDDMHGLRARVRTISDDYPRVVLQTRPVGYWRLEEASGVLRDELTFANNLTNVAGTVTYAQAGALADGSKALLFNLGTANAPNFNPTDGLTAVSFACWVKCASAWSGGTNVALASTNTGHYIGINASNEPFFSLKISGTQRTLSASSGAMNTTDWYFLVLTWSSGGPMRAYVNGVAAGTSASFSGSLTVATSGVTVGGISPGSTRIPAYIDEPAIWNRELHPLEIADLYAARLYGGSWASSPLADRNKYLYVHDDATERVDASDPLTQDHDIAF